jgi:hypothetical protein
LEVSVIQKSPVLSRVEYTQKGADYGQPLANRIKPVIKPVIDPITNRVKPITDSVKGAFGGNKVKVDQSSSKANESAVKPGDIPVKPNEPAVKPQESTIKGDEPTTKPNEPTVKPQELSIKPQESLANITETTTASSQSKGILEADGRFRDTRGWSGQPTSNPAAGQEHLGYIQHGLDMVNKIHPELITRLDEVLPRIDEPLPEHQQRINALSEEAHGIYSNPENNKLLNMRREIVEKEMGSEAAARKDQLNQRLKDIESESSKLQGDIDAERVRLEKEAHDLMRTFRNRLRGRYRDASQLANRVQIEQSAESVIQNSEKTIKQVRSELGEFYKLVGSRGLSPDPISIKFTKPRAHANDGYINIGNDPSKQIIFHEMAHHIEFKHPEVGQASKAFVNARSRHVGHPGELFSLHDLVPNAKYSAEEVAMLGGFFDPYVGKIYSNLTSEVISTGMQHFTGPQNMLNFYRQDPEHFLYVLGVILAI